MFHRSHTSSHRSSYSGSYHRKSGPFLPFLLVRLVISLIIFAIFGFGIYRAIVHFSGYDPLHLDPQQLLITLMSSDESAKLIKKLLSVDPKNSEDLAQTTQNSSSPQGLTGNKILTFAIVADSHNKNELLAKALQQAKNAGAKFVIGTGDYSDVGTTEELMAAKKVFDRSGLPYYLTAGDHDLWNGRDKGYEPDHFFKEVFGPPYQSFGDSNIRFVIVYNSDNYFGVDPVQMHWLEGELERIKQETPTQTFVILHEPLYHPSSDHVMGKNNPKLAEQAHYLTQLFNQYQVGEVFAGDVHFYGRFQEPETNLKMTVDGAVTDERNVQTPRFLLVDVSENGSYNITDTEIK